MTRQELCVSGRKVNMSANPINFFLLLGMLFWFPQLNEYRRALHESKALYTFFTTTHTLAPGQLREGPAKVAGLTDALEGSSDRCLVKAVRIFQKTNAPAELIFESQEMAPHFTLRDEAGVIRIDSTRMKVIGQPRYDQLKWEQRPVPEPITSLWSEFSINDPRIQKQILESKSNLLTEVSCVPFGQTITATGYISAKQTMSYTLTYPFTISFLPDTDTAKILSASVSKNYFGAALIFLMIASLSLGIMTNALLRGRITLELEPVSLIEHPLRFFEGSEDPHLAMIQKFTPQIKDIQIVLPAELPIFYRYSWEDGISMKGRRALFAVTASSIFILEIDPQGKPCAQREIPWNDLFCVYFSQWGPMDTWLDVLTREGERYQLSVIDAREAKTLLKRWDAAELLQHVPAA